MPGELKSTSNSPSASLTSCRALPHLASIRGSTLFSPTMRCSRLPSVPWKPQAKQLALGSFDSTLTPNTSGPDLPSVCLHACNGHCEMTHPVRLCLLALVTPTASRNSTILAAFTGSLPTRRP